MSSLRYISSVSFTDAGDQSLSAMAAVRGHIRESTVSDETSSLHMVASPPRMLEVGGDGMLEVVVSKELSGIGSFR